MVCDSCGHLNDEHKPISSSMFYCSQCKTVESSISFSQEAGNDPSKSSDVITDLYYAVRGMRR